MSQTRRLVYLSPVLLLALVLPLGLAVAQTDSAPAVPDLPNLAEVRSEKLALDELGALLKPLYAEELTEEAKAWKGLLKAKAEEIAAATLARKAAEDKTALDERLTTLRDERQALTDRLNAVLVALEGKGGDVAADRTYIGQVSGIIDDAQDVSGMWMAVQGWVTSTEGGIRWGLNIVKFIVVLFVFKLIASIVGGLTRRALSKARTLSDLLRDFIANTIRNVIFLLGLIVGLSMLEVNIGPLLAGIGVIGFVVGFALQDTLGNFASGFMILLYRPYDVGDVVSAGGVTGKVDSMSLVSTTFKTPDNQNIIVPNGSIWGGVIQNITANDTRRVDLTFGIGYDDDINKAQKVLEDILQSHELVLKDPAPVVELHELADSSVNFVARPWTKTSDYWRVYWDLTRAVKERFDAEGLSIPYPQQDVHMHQVAG